MAIASTPFEVAVVGGGIGGLALGQLLQSVPEVNVTVYERSRQLFDRLSGYRVMIAPETLDILRANLRHDVWQAIVPSIGLQPPEGQETVFMKNDGTVLHRWNPTEFKDCVSVSRWKLRQGLLHGSRDFVKTGKAFEKYQKLSNGKTKVFFQDGTDITCDLLVGADGISSKIKSQFLPYSKTKSTDLVVVYFKVPLTAQTMALLPSETASMIFCPNNQNITLATWQNPEQLWASEYDLHNIAVDDSFIMFGYGSPVSSFVNRSKPPNQLTSIELKAEVIEWARRSGISDDLLELVQMSVVNTAHLQSIKKCKDVRPWDDPCITLLGDSVMSIPTTLGKGANCALIDAVSLADMIRNFPSLSRTSTSLAWRIALRKYSEENLLRRDIERKRSAFMQNVLYLGSNSLTTQARDFSLKYALRWVERPEEAHMKRSSKRITDMSSVNGSKQSVTSSSGSEKTEIVSNGSW